MIDNNLTKILDKNKIDLKNLNSEDVKTLLEQYIKGEFGKEIFSTYLKEANASLQTLITGLNSFIDKTSYSSKKYTDTLDSK
jgi:hypothetical protein